MTGHACCRKATSAGRRRPARVWSHGRLVEFEGRTRSLWLMFPGRDRKLREHRESTPRGLPRPGSACLADVVGHLRIRAKTVWRLAILIAVIGLATCLVMAVLTWLLPSRTAAPSS